MKQKERLSLIRGKPAFSPGGWKWMIVLAHGISQSVVLAVVQNFALLFGDLFSRLEMTATDVGLLLNCNAAIGSIFALVAGSLLRRLGCRKMAALGAAMLALGVGCSGHATTFQQLFFSYGFLSSVGAGLLLASTGAAVNTCFAGDQRGCRTAAAIAGAAPMAAPALASSLLERYGLPGAALVLAGVSLNCVAAACLLRPARLQQRLATTAGKLTSKEDRAKKQTNPTIRRGTIVPVMKIDAPEEEVKQGGRRRSSAMSRSSGPQRRGTDGWLARQSMGSIYTGTNSRIYDSRSYQTSAGDDDSLLDQRSSRASSIALAGHESSHDAHSKTLGIPNPGQRGGERRGSSLSAGYQRWSQRLSVSSVHSTGSALAVVIDEEDSARGQARDLNQRRLTATSVASSSLEVPGEQTPGSRRGSEASTRSGRPRKASWWGRLSVGSVYSVGGSRLFGSRALAVAYAEDDYADGGILSQVELSQHDGSTNSSLNIPTGDSLNARRQSEDSKIGNRLRGGSSGKLDLPKPYERTRQLSVSSVRSAASSTGGYLTAAQSLRSSASQGSGLWWSTLSLASARSDEQAQLATAIQEVEERDPADPPGETTRLLDDEDMATPESPQEERRNVRVPTPTAFNSTVENTLITFGDTHGLEGSRREDKTLLDINTQPQFLSDHLNKILKAPEESFDLVSSSGEDKILLPVDTRPQFRDPLTEIRNSEEDEKVSPVDRQSKFPENSSIEKMLATPEETSDLGSSDGEDSATDPEVLARQSILSDDGKEKDKGNTRSFRGHLDTLEAPLMSAESSKGKESQNDLVINVEHCADTKNYGNDSSREGESVEKETADGVTVMGKTENNLEVNNAIISNPPDSEAFPSSGGMSRDEADRRENLLGDKQEFASAPSSPTPTDKTIAAKYELSYKADGESTNVMKVDGDSENMDKNDIIGNSVETHLKANFTAGTEEKSSLPAENKLPEHGQSKPTANSSGNHSERYSIIVSVPEGAAAAGVRGSPYELDLAALRSTPWLCLLLGLALAHCADLNHAFFTPLLLASREDVPLALSAVAAADFAARVLVPAVMDGSRKKLFLAGLLLLVVSRAVLTMFTEFTKTMLACVFLGASRGVKSICFPTVMLGNDTWSTLCLQMVSQGVIFLTLGPFMGYIADWSGSYGSSIIAINVATIVAVILCCVENFYPTS